MLLGALDPLEGSLIVVPGTGLAALGAFLGKSRRRTLLFWSSALVATGVAGMWIASTAGGFGGETGRPIGWGLLILLPYALGWLLGLAGTVLVLIESFQRPLRTDRGGHTRRAARNGWPRWGRSVSTRRSGRCHGRKGGPRTRG